MVQTKTTPNQITTTAILKQMHVRATDKMAMSTQDGLVILRFADILYCEAMSNYCRIYMKDGSTHVASRPLKRVVSLLPQSEFIRIHQSYTVRFDMISSVGQEVHLLTGVSLPVSRSHRKDLFTYLRAHLSII